LVAILTVSQLECQAAQVPLCLTFASAHEDAAPAHEDAAPAHEDAAPAHEDAASCIRADPAELR
jgi:hypothetical protein